MWCLGTPPQRQGIKGYTGSIHFPGAPLGNRGHLCSSASNCLTRILNDLNLFFIFFDVISCVLLPVNILSLNKNLVISVLAVLCARILRCVCVCACVCLFGVSKKELWWSGRSVCLRGLLRRHFRDVPNKHDTGLNSFNQRNTWLQLTVF